MPVIEIKGQSIAYGSRTSKRAKGISVRYSLSKGLEVVYPPGPRQPSPESLLLERSDWIISAIDKLAEARARLPSRHYREGETFLFRGASYKLRLEKDSSRSRIAARLTGDCLALSLPDSVQLTDSQTISAAVLDFYRQQAKCYLPRRLGDLAKRHGFQYEKVRVKNQKTRWGSCSIKRNINLNLRLMMAPDEAIDYVIIHELCHLRELNHTPAFWALVESCCPEFRHWQAWFKQNGANLTL